MRHAFFVSLVVLTTALGVRAQEIPNPYRIGPALVREVKPLYTPGLLNRNVAGFVELSAIVLIDGTVGDVSVTRSLDPEADEEAIRAVKQWGFKPATLNGAAVPVTVSIQITFSRQRAPTVYRIEDGVTAPVATRRVNPMYPPDVAREGVIGTVVLEGVVRPDGTISGILVKKSADKRLESEAIKALSEWLFKPGELAGRPVPVIVQIEMRFNLK